MSLEESILTEIHGSVKERNLHALSMRIEELRTRGLLTDANKAKIEGWIEENFPISIVSIGKSLLESEDDEDEKEREEKIPPFHPKNVCSSDTQKDLTGDKMSPMMEQVITFLLPKSKKSECITEYDISKIVGERADEIHLYDSVKKELLISVIVYRLPTSGIWIVGHPMYFRIFRAYQLESFGKHIISVATHRIGSVWRQEHELFLAKPLHWNDFTSFIRDNTSFPEIPSACACMFKPEESDWSVTAKHSLPVDECQWMIPTWNGIPIFLGKTCGLLLNWSNKKLRLPDIWKDGLTTLQQPSMDSMKELIWKLHSSARNKELYVRTDQVEKVKIVKFSYEIIWVDPDLRIRTVEYISEVSARLGKWPDKFEIKIRPDRAIKGIPNELMIEDSPLLNIGKVNALTEGEIELSWMLDIAEGLPEIPTSPLSIRKIEEIPGFIVRLKYNINKDQLFVVQGAHKIAVTKLHSISLIYGDGSELVLGVLTEAVSKIRAYIQSRGPPVRLRIELELLRDLPERGESIEVVDQKNEIILPSTDSSGSFDNMADLIYVVNLS